MGIAEFIIGLSEARTALAPPTRSYNSVAARANATNNKAVEDDITARNGSGSIIPGNVRNG